MKKETIISITIVTYIVAMIVMFFGVDKYIKNKDNKLSNEIHDKIYEVFANQDQFVDIAYSGYKVGSERISIPPKPVLKQQSEEFTKIFGDLNSQNMDEWNENYGDLYNMYRINYQSSDWSSPYKYEDGWNLVIISYDHKGVYVNWFFPYAVGYKKQNYQWEYSYLPSVQTAVENAFEFYTSDSKSQYFEDFEKGSYNRVMSEIYDAENEYYYVQKDETRRLWHAGVKPLLEEYDDFDDETSPFQYGYMHNGYYKVFTALTQPQTYTIKKYSWGPDIQDKKELWLYWGMSLTALFLIIIIPLCIVVKKHRKEKEEDLYDKLKRLCNPAEFISKNNYDKEKVDLANKIYAKLMSTSPDNKEALNELQILAVKKLGIDLINKDKVQELMKIVNPKNFINPYNAEKLALANELYAIITKEGLTYNELEEVEEKAKAL